MYLQQPRTITKSNHLAQDRLPLVEKLGQILSGATRALTLLLKGL